MINDLTEYFTPKEVGKMLKISARTVSRLCEAGKIRYVPFGNLKRISKESILEYLNENERFGFVIEQTQRYKPARRAQ
jgi:excisionase family DNA binding protein